MMRDQAAEKALPVSDMPELDYAGELKKHWALLIACTLGLAVGAHSLIFYTAGLFIRPLQAEFHWSRAEVSLGPTIVVACLAVISPLIGTLLDRIGERKIIWPSLLILAVAFFVMSRLSGDLGFYYLVFAITAITTSGSTTPSYTRLLNRTFSRARGTALGIALIGTGLASAILPPTLGPLIATYGWRYGYLALACIALCAMPCIMLLIWFDGREKSVRTRRSEQGARVGEALRDPLFWTLALCLFCIALATTGLIVHYIPLLIDQGVNAASAAKHAGLIGIFLIVGRLATGLVVDRFFAPYVGAIVMVISALGYFCLAFGGAEFASFGALAIGLSFGTEGDLVGYLAARYFGLRAYGRIYGLLYASVLAGTSLSPFLYGSIFDKVGSYKPGLIGAGCLMLASAILFMTMRRFEARPYNSMTAEVMVSG